MRSGWLVVLAQMLDAGLDSAFCCCISVWIFPCCHFNGFSVRAVEALHGVEHNIYGMSIEDCIYLRT